MRIAILRGPKAKKFEMQAFEPLNAHHDLRLYTSRRTLFDTDGIDITKVPLPCLDGRTSRLPYPVNLAYGALLARLGFNKWLIGLEDELQGYDIAHGMDLTTAFTYQAIRAKRKNPDLRVVTTIWQNIPFFVPGPGDLEFGNRRVRETVLKQTDLFLPVSERAKTALMLEGVEEDRILVAPTGIDTERFSPAPPDRDMVANLDTEPGAFTLLFVGRLSRQKGVYPLVRALKRLALDEGPRTDSTRLLIRGEGPEEVSLRTEVEKLGVEDRVVFVPRLPYEKLSDLYNHADAFVLPSIPSRDWQEHLGFVLLEAMACGLPIIGSYCGAIPEVVGDAGLLVQPKDPHTLSEAYRKLRDDDKLRDKLAKNARARALDRFDATAAAERYEEAYQNVLS